MNIKSSLASFSLIELLQLIDSGSKSGMLSIYTPPESQIVGKKSTYHLWFDTGKLVAVTINTDKSDLITSIESHGWLKRRVIERLENLCPKNVALGTYLKNNGVLKPEQLQLLFQIKLEQTYHIFENASPESNYQVTFVRISNAKTLPLMEMTGIKISARQIALLALRKVKKWDNISSLHILPAPNSVLEKLVKKPDFDLDPLELSIWKKADGKTSISRIAKQLHQSLTNVQRAAFKLVVAGVLSEISRSQVKIRASLAPKTLFPITVINNTIASLAQQIQSQPNSIFSWVQSIVSFAILVLLLVP